jgi:hypothetical protein
MRLRKSAQNVAQTIFCHKTLSVKKIAEQFGLFMALPKNKRLAKIRPIWPP